MTQNPDGSITLTPADVHGVDALIVAADRQARDAGSYTSKDATQFAREWVAAREPR